MFREQVGTLSTWFDRWSQCEQTVAMVALSRRLNPTQARFLTSVLHKQLSECTELRRAEILANDSNFVASLANNDTKEGLIRDLLNYLPLLNVKNSDVKGLYLALIQKVLKYTLENSSYMEEARQLLSYCLIHPAFTSDDRGVFSTLLHQFEDKLSHTGTTVHENPYQPHISGSPPNLQEYGGTWQNSSPPHNTGQLSKSPGAQGGFAIGSYASNNGHRNRRSNSLTPPVLHSDNWHSQEDLGTPGKPRSLSLSSEVSPQSSIASSGSGSETHLDDQTPAFSSPGMKEVPAWLKSLRLHKYSPLFAHMTYEEMLTITEAMLETQGVTKGARHKIVLSVGKLKDRISHCQKLLDEMTSDKEVIRNVVNELKWILSTPIKPFVDSEETSDSVKVKGDKDNLLPEKGSEIHKKDPEVSKENELPAIIVRVIGKACELNTDLECETLLASLLEKCLSHEAFSQKQKKMLSLWRHQQSPITRRGSGGHNLHYQAHQRMMAVSGGMGGHMKHSKSFTPRVLNLTASQAHHESMTPQTPWNVGCNSNSIHALFMSKRPSLPDTILEVSRSQSSVHRTKSAPIPNIFGNVLSSSPPVTYGTEFFGTGLTRSSETTGPIGISGEKSQYASGLCDTTNVSQGGTTPTNTASTSDITSRLESLCLSMTEAALGPAFNSY